MTAIIPRRAEHEVVEVLQDLLSQATEQILQEHGDVHDGGPVLEAEVTLRMLQLSENHRSVQRVAQGFVVAYVARNQLWQAHPDEFARSSLRNFLRAAGLGESTVSDLTALGEILVPFCDHNEIPIDSALTPGDWPKLREAIPALRQAAKRDDTGTARRILADVRNAVNRDAIRAKYRRRRAKLGRGTTVRVGNRALIVISASDSDVPALVRRLGGTVEWNLYAQASQSGKVVRVEVVADGKGD